MRAELGGGQGETSSIAADPLWWPPSKVAGRYLAPFLAGLVGEAAGPPGAAGVEVDVELSRARPGLTARRTGSCFLLRYSRGR